ncbi:MAG: PLDc N-terminal domain-containing protein, partial [Planctomycetaceae bacterium]|nr:PLDc N-terminal domain-containing protein [Planctomycetaceae bacterium]
MNWTELDLLWWEFVLGSVTALGYLATLFLVPRVLLTKKRWPASTVAWLMAIITLPVIGGLCFLVFGIDRMGPRVRRRREVAAAVQRSPAPLNEA